MRWFKHFTDNHRGRSVQYLMDELGHSGLCYFIIMEMCAEKLERPNGLETDRKLSGSLSDDDCEFSFHRRVVESALRLRRAAVERLLSCCQTSNLLTYSLDGELIKIKMPILLDLLDYDSKRSRTVRGGISKRSRLESESESESEKNQKHTFAKKDIVRKKTGKLAAVPADSKAQALIAHYCQCFKLLHKVNPSVSKSDSGVLINLFGEMGSEKAKDLISAYFEMPDAYVKKSKHPIKLLSYKINEVLVFAETGKFHTQTQAHQADHMASNAMLLKQIDREEREVKNELK